MKTRVGKKDGLKGRKRNRMRSKKEKETVSKRKCTCLSRRETSRKHQRRDTMSITK